MTALKIAEERFKVPIAGTANCSSQKLPGFF